MKIAIDLDGVVVDLNGACADIGRWYTVDRLLLWDDIFTQAGLTHEEWLNWLREQEIFSKCYAVPGAERGIRALLEAGHEIHFVTCRPEWAVDATYEWIDNYFETEDNIHILSNGESKSTVECDIYLDDAPHVLTDLCDNTPQDVCVVRYERPWNKDCMDWTQSVADWAEFVTLVQALKEKDICTKGLLPGPKVATTMADDNRYNATVELSGTGYAKCDIETQLHEAEEKLVDQFDKLFYGEINPRWISPEQARKEYRVTDPNTGGQKGTKPQRMDLLPWDALMEVSTHYGVGAEKYEARNWERGYAWHLTYASLMRHLSAWWQGEDKDEEGLDHLNAVVFHALALRAFTLRGIGTDDRP